MDATNGIDLCGTWTFPLASAALFNPAFFFAIPGLVLVANSATRFKDYVESS